MFSACNPMSWPIFSSKIFRYTRISNEKQDRALRAREKIHQEMAARLRAENTAKVKAAATRREDKAERTIAWMTEKMQRADELRDSHLEGKRKKAKEEDAKINEIAFINKLEEENKKMEAIDKLNESQERLNDLEEERQRKRTGSAAKQEAARARRFAMEAERQSRLQLHESKRLAREEEVAQVKRRTAEEREKASAQRLDATHRRLDDLETSRETERKGLEEKLKAKQSGSENRRAETDKLRKDSPSKTRKEQAAGAAGDAGCGSASPPRPKPPKPDKSAKKRMKRIFLRFADIQDGGWTEKLANPKETAVLLKPVHTSIANVLAKLAAGWFVGVDPAEQAKAATYEKNILKLQKMLAERGANLTTADRLAVCRVVAMVYATAVLNPALPGALSDRAVRVSHEVLLHSAEPGAKAAPLYAEAFVPEGRVFVMMDALVLCLQDRCDTEPQREGTAVASLLMARMARALLKGRGLAELNASNPDQIVDDILLFCSANRLLESIKAFFLWVPPTTIDSAGATARIVENTLQMAIVLTESDPKRRRASHGVFMASLQQSELIGISDLLYTVVMHCGGKRKPVTLTLNKATASIILLGLKALNHMAALDRALFQQALGGQTSSLSLCHVLARLIGYCAVQDDAAEARYTVGLLHEAILLAGEFTVGNPENQAMLHVGGSATILPMLCSLPFKYFSDARYKDVLFPTLLASCHGCERNTEVLRKELNCDLLVRYAESFSGTAGAGAASDAGRFACDRRFPKEMLAAAAEFFKRHSTA